MIKKNDKVIISQLRKDARTSLSGLASEFMIPASTVYDRTNTHEKKTIKKYTALLDYPSLGYHARMFVALKLCDIRQKHDFLDFLKANTKINSIYHINFGFHFLVDAVFRNTAEAEGFLNHLEESYSLEQKHIFNIVEEIQSENFLTRPEHFD